MLREKLDFTSKCKTNGHERNENRRIVTVCGGVISRQFIAAPFVILDLENNKFKMLTTIHLSLEM